ncbi:hypothetical protein NUBL515_48260 [Klebsiella pneumoniae]|nr:hypothetical protein NUBL515_48260 [Klebsiella pneumoniae]
MTNNQLAENSVIQLLNSVKLARDNAERADNRVDHSFYYALTIALEELQERRKAAMDGEPVVECEKLAIENLRTAMEGIGHIRRTLDETVGGLHGTHVEPDVLAECKAICDAIYAAYRHAQPAPVVPTFDEWLELSGNKPLGWVKDAMRESYEACRAAMLSGGKS